MSYDPALPTTLDKIRLMVGDIDTDNEIFPDETYESRIAEYSDWRLAAAWMAESVAVAIEQDISSFSAGGDLSVSWSDRTRSLRALAIRLRQEVAADAGISLSTIVPVSLARDNSGRNLEYVGQRYRRLLR